MGLIKELIEWWTVDRPRDKAGVILRKAQRELAAAEARLEVLKASDKLCKNFTFTDAIKDESGEIARLKVLIQQTEDYLKNK